MKEGHMHLSLKWLFHLTYVSCVLQSNYAMYIVSLCSVYRLSFRPLCLNHWRTVYTFTIHFSTNQPCFGRPGDVCGSGRSFKKWHFFRYRFDCKNLPRFSSLDPFFATEWWLPIVCSTHTVTHTWRWAEWTIVCKKRTWSELLWHPSTLQKIVRLLMHYQ